jgi:hypothetical protein
MKPQPSGGCLQVTPGQPSARSVEPQSTVICPQPRSSMHCKLHAAWRPLFHWPMQPLLCPHACMILMERAPSIPHLQMLHQLHQARQGLPERLHLPRPQRTRASPRLARAAPCPNLSAATSLMEATPAWHSAATVPSRRSPSTPPSFPDAKSSPASLPWAVAAPQVSPSAAPSTMGSSPCASPPAAALRRRPRCQRQRLFALTSLYRASPPPAWAAPCPSLSAAA